MVSSRFDIDAHRLGNLCRIKLSGDPAACMSGRSGGSPFESIPTGYVALKFGCCIYVHSAKARGTEIEMISSAVPAHGAEEFIHPARLPGALLGLLDEVVQAGRFFAFLLWRGIGVCFPGF